VKPRVVVLRGHSANPWELRTWELLTDRYDIALGVTGRNVHDVASVALDRVPVRALRDRLPRGRVGDLAALALGDRYLSLPDALEGADIVHSAELGVWFSGQPAMLRERLGFKLALTVWETIPFGDTFRRFRGRAHRTAALDADLFLAATKRARECLLLEGVAAERITVCPPGIDVDHFATAGEPPTEHLLVSPGRLVWEKGHYDVLRAVALLEPRPRLLIVGAGPERERLLRYADELGIAAQVEIRSVPYDEMPSVFARATCVVLASLPIPFWEEQFGMVLAEAMAAGVPIVASTSGAIPEVLAGADAALFAPGDWVGLAERLREGPLARSPGTRAVHDPACVERYSTRAAAGRIAAAYDRLLAS
jgi:glycosyltransferase involved in cell wall biosynthesis